MSRTPFGVFKTFAKKVCAHLSFLFEAIPKEKRRLARESAVETATGTEKYYLEMFGV